MLSETAVEWGQIDSVLLDMDGTLLDLRFDNWFWSSLVPEHYAQAQGLSVAEAQALLAPRFTTIAHTLPWYCIDHWSRELDLDIRAPPERTSSSCRAQSDFSRSYSAAASASC